MRGNFRHGARDFGVLGTQAVPRHIGAHGQHDGDDNDRGGGNPRLLDWLRQGIFLLAPLPLGRIGTQETQRIDRSGQVLQPAVFQRFQITPLDAYRFGHVLDRLAGLSPAQAQLVADRRAQIGYRRDFLFRGRIRHVVGLVCIFIGTFFLGVVYSHLSHPLPDRGPFYVGPAT
jgi:hypothetical protein